MHFIRLSTIFVLLLFYCNSNTNASNLETLKSWMTGSFSSEAQSVVDSNYFDIRLEMQPIWEKDKKAFWFYVEQASARNLQKPYRQRIYKLYQKDEDTFVSEVYLLPEPDLYIGAHNNLALFKKLKPKKLTIKDGCQIFLKYNGKYFEGSTIGKNCSSKLRGSSYASAQVKVFNNRMETWDQGFDTNDEQVWGATKGAYIFMKNQTNDTYPTFKKETVVDNYHGTNVEDPYRWLEDESSVFTRDWINQQNNFTKNVIEKYGQQEKIKNRLTQLLNYDRIAVPFKTAGNYFKLMKKGLENQYSLYIKRADEKEYTKLIDGNNLSEDGNVSLSFAKASNDGKYLAYSLSNGGSDWKEFKVMDLESGKELDDHLKWIKFSGINWYKDGFFYTRYDSPKDGQVHSEANKHSSIYYHKIGEKQEQDVLIFEDKANPKIGYGVSVSNDEKYLFLHAWKGTHGQQLSYRKISIEQKAFQPIFDDWNYDYYVVASSNDVFYISTNMNAANSKLIKFNVKTGKTDDVISESEYPIDRIIYSEEKFVVQYLKDVKNHLEIREMNGKLFKTIDLPSDGTVSRLSSSKNDPEVFFNFSSYVQPNTIFSFDVNVGDLTTLEIEKVDFNHTDYESNLTFYKSKDGTKIPIIITHKKGIKLDGNNPTLLYGYGGFNIAYKPRFDNTRLLFLEQGGIYAVANLRGGSEYGEAWHKAGMLENKQNVFDDFIAAAEFLVENNYTTNDKLGIIGRSNGGLLIGATINQKPDICKVAFPVVGVMDMLRYQKFTIGYAWAVEYGSSDNEDEFKYIYKYSPLHNIEQKEYPATLVLTADKDDRVVPAHSFKYTSTLQENQTGNLPILIRVDTNAGHGNGTSTQKLIDTYTSIYTFAFYHLGIKMQ